MTNLQMKRKTNEFLFNNVGDKKFFRILQDLECRLQEITRRGDYGVPHDPGFAVDTLAAAIVYVTGLKGAEEGLLQETIQDLIGFDTKRKSEKAELITRRNAVKEEHQ